MSDRETSQKWWGCALLAGAVLGAAGAVSEGRWARAIFWLFLAGLWALFILLEWKKKRSQP
jgi:dolichyl-phosphate-mannose--protein O-mannosyl transferase